MTPGDDDPAAPSTSSGEGRSLLGRMLGALQLQSAVYDEIAADDRATNQATVVVAITAIAQALVGPERVPFADIPIALAWSYFGWLVPGLLVWVMATRALGLVADLPRLLRCTGFATTPQVLWILITFSEGSEPFELALGAVIFGLALIANILAIRQAFSVSTIRAVQTFALGFLAFAGFAFLLGGIAAQLGTRL